MKRIIFALPLCIFLANCSSTKNAAPPAGPGISNVNVSANGAAPTAVNTSATTSPAGRDWAYRAKYDSTLNGNWALQGMLASNGTWTSTVQDTAGSVAATSNAQATTPTDATGMGATGAMGAAGSMSTDMSTNNSTITGAQTKNNAKTNKRAVYDSAKVRLGYEVQSPAAVIDSSLLQPYKYWGRTPSLVINTSSRVFSGTTGCNSMSGSFNFSGNDLQFNKNISTSRMNCNDYDEAGFLAALKKVDSYNLNGNLLELKQGSTVLLTFAKK